ncbi:MAG: Asp-tRNA(Asn)/Glu-tRNA(Gln) amidotransferase GatCAB subunit B [Phycisphaerae bacterium]|nr:Asp-tRNA(Asn)/Glu-tRNA(Gln) amidotransferase GatCAB subunit B [Phycisphaerae bacterium]|tara:strand:- start:3384 stop:4910 length:1527 start_codon:yes stop_codon:yes gene_type:complete
MTTIASTQLKIGMEIHVELATRSKMFSRSANIAHPDNYDAPPNSLCDPVVLGLPGALPVMNREAVEMSMMVGMALGCTIPDFSKWDRKNYFYPDLPKGYQISQYDLPLCEGGSLEIPVPDGGTRNIGITRAHLEEDTGKTGHELPGGLSYEGSLIDYNRAGVPLLEIVSEPDLRCAEEAVAFGKELRNLCRFLGVTEGVMQRGHMRFEPNINMIITLEDGTTVATPIAEIKNLNSFRAVQGAIEHEAKRQVEAWKSDGLVMGAGAKSTRGWDDQRQVTFLQRAKEDAHDYRYFPEPDLIPVVVDDRWRSEIETKIPELPNRRRVRYASDYGLSGKDAMALTSDRDPCYFYEACIESTGALVGDGMKPSEIGTAAAKFLLNVGARLANERGRELQELGIDPQQVAGVIELRHANDIGSNAAEQLFEMLCDSDAEARDAAEEAGLLQVTDTGQLDAWVDEAIAAQPQAAEDFASGKDAAVGRLVGHVMKASGGQADAAAVRNCLVEKLRS